MKLPRFNLKDIYSQLNQRNKELKEMRRLQMLAVAMRSAYSPQESRPFRGIDLRFKMVFPDQSIYVLGDQRASSLPTGDEVDGLIGLADQSIDILWDKRYEHPEDLAESGVSEFLHLPFIPAPSSPRKIREFMDGEDRFLSVEKTWHFWLTTTQPVAKPSAAIMDPVIDWLDGEFSFFVNLFRDSHFEVPTKEEGFAAYVLAIDGLMQLSWDWSVQQ